jgi:uncharacterized membrane protein YhaH (DUF805 family)
MHWFVQGWRNVSDSSGRSRRREYWWFTLGNLVLFLAIHLIEALVFGLELEIYPISAIFNFVAALAGIVVTVRRLHDIGKSGWWILIGIIPFVGWLILLIFTLRDGEPGSNQWGPNPKEPTRQLAEVF